MLQSLHLDEQGGGYGVNNKVKREIFIKILLSLNSPRLERCRVLGNTARKEVFGGRNLICRSHHTSKRNTKLEILLHRGSHVAVRDKLSHSSSF